MGWAMTFVPQPKLSIDLYNIIPRYNDMKKLYLVLIVIVVLVAGYMISFKYFNAKNNKEWFQCESNDDCIVYDGYGNSCNVISINKQYEDQYNWYSTKIKIGRKITLPFIRSTTPLCEFIGDPVARCINNRCDITPSCGPDGFAITDQETGISCCEGLDELPATRPNGELVEGLTICANCGDGICKTRETKFNCPEDCSDS